MIERPSGTYLLLLPDIYECGDAPAMLARLAGLNQTGVMSSNGSSAPTTSTRTAQREDRLRRMALVFA
jgi:hypothetical protein